MQFNTVVENDQKSREKFQIYAGNQEKFQKIRKKLKSQKEKWKSWKNQKIQDKI